MDYTHIHLFLNHFPLMGTFFCLFLILYQKFRPSKEIEKVIYYLVVFNGVLAIPVFLTGEPAEEALQYLPKVDHFIEEHEEIGKIAFILCVINAFLVSGLLFFSNKIKKQEPLIKKAVIGLVLLTAVLLSVTSYRGGQIRHTEIRNTPAENSPEE